MTRPAVSTSRSRVSSGNGARSNQWPVSSPSRERPPPCARSRAIVPTRFSFATRRRRGRMLTGARSLGDDRAVLARALGLVERLVGALERVFDPLLEPIAGEAGGEGHEDRLFLVHEEAACQRA